MGYCEHYKQVFTTTQGKHGELWLARGRCWRWTCEYCADINRQLWKRHIERGVGATHRKYWWFVTLTASSEAHWTGNTVDNLQKAWKRLYDRLNRKFWAYRAVYCWVFEPHESGELHIHALMSFNARAAGMKRGELDKDGNDIEVTRWFKDNMAQLGAGYQASCKPLDSSSSIKKRVRYVTKYMTKQTQSAFSDRKRFRYIHCSQNFGALRQKSELKWNISSGVYRGDLRFFQHIRDTNKNKILTEQDFDGNKAYPPELG